MFYDTLFTNISKEITLTQEEKIIIKNYVKFVYVKKGEILLQEGAYCKHFYFVEKGCLRLFNDNGNNDTTVLFAPENWWMSDIDSFTRNKQATFSIDALEDSEVWTFSKDNLEILFLKVPRLERFFRLLFQNAFGLSLRRMSLILSTDAAKRYDWFGKQYPKLELRISQKHIASYLGITTVFLSKIRHKDSPHT